MTTQILKIKGDWQEVVDDCRATVGKPGLGKQPGEAFKRKILLAEHSPIRDICVRWRWENIKSWVATHWARHKFEKFIRTQREDRTGVPRDELPQGALVTLTGEANAQQLIDAWRKRLCCQAHPQTRAYAVDFKFALGEVEPELSDALVPNCIYRGGCPEMNPCEHYAKFVFWCLHEKEIQVPYCMIRTRYDLYNEWLGGQKDEP